MWKLSESRAAGREVLGVELCRLDCGEGSPRREPHAGTGKRKTLPGPSTQFGRLVGRVVPQLHKGHRNLSSFVIRAANDPARFDVGMGFQDRLDLPGEDIFPPTMSISLIRPVIDRYPSASSCPISPVWNHPSASRTLAVASGMPW